MTDLSISYRNPTQQKEYYMLLLKSCKGAGCVELIQRLLSEPGLFVFEEFLQVPVIRELENQAQYKPYLELLKLFAYGTFQDYQAKKNELPKLSEKQLKKLRQLSLISMAAKRQTLPYKDLMEALGFTEISDLESIIIDTIYNGAIQGRLDQRHMQLHIEYAIGRDLAPGELENVAKELDHWCQRIEVVLRDLDERIKQVQEATLANVSTKAEFNRQFETAMDVALSSSMRTDTDTMMSDVRTK